MATAKKKPAKKPQRKTRVAPKRKTRVVSKTNNKKPRNLAAISTYIVVFTVFLFILAAGIGKIYMANQT